jgi:carboxymethylenebutenolidase
VAYDAVFAETVGVRGDGDDLVEAYAARPLAPGPRGGVIVIHHMPGYDRESRDIVRRFAVMGYNAVCVNLYSREGPGVSHEEAAAQAIARGGVPDGQFTGDAKGAARWLRDLPSSNGKVGVIGFCSGGRQAILAAAGAGVDAAVDCYGGMVVEDPPAGFPVYPVRDAIADISVPLLGLFGQDDVHPAPAHVDELERLLREHDKAYEFHRYDGTGHAFFSVDRPSYYRGEAALDGWQRIEAFYRAHLGS